ncbi:sciellin isoform X1 [Callorhinchus milii]|uniref:sciellin isoform X1 n=1 Tax=Callorhinchus milii TaxID=7868 RepID=UPI001C3FC7ED|nr:sciellin isoform X1 [Callorhinchus milii]
MSFFQNLKKSTNTDSKEPSVDRQQAISESQKKQRYIRDGEWIKNKSNPEDVVNQPENINYGRIVLGGNQPRQSPTRKESGTDKYKSATLDRPQGSTQLIDTVNKMMLNRYRSEEFLFRETSTPDIPSKHRQSTTLDRPKMFGNVVSVRNSEQFHGFHNKKITLNRYRSEEFLNRDTSGKDPYKASTLDSKSRPLWGSTEKLPSSTSQPSSINVKTPTSEKSPSKPFWGSTEKLPTSQPSPTNVKTPSRNTSSMDSYKPNSDRKSKPFWGSTEKLPTNQPSSPTVKTPSSSYRTPSVKVEEPAKPIVIKGILPKDETPTNPRTSWISKDSLNGKTPVAETPYLIDLSPNTEETRNSTEDLDKIKPFIKTQTKSDPYSKDLIDVSDQEDNSENISPYPTTTTKTTYDPKSSRINGGNKKKSFTKPTYEPENRNSTSSLRSDPPNNLQTRVITTAFSVAEKTSNDPNACSYCFKPISLSPRIIIDDMNLNTHASCFKCQICSQSLEDIQAGQSVWIHRQMIHCEPCYDQMRAKLTYP